MTSALPPSKSGVPSSAMQFSPIQREVFDALCENSDRLAKMYFGAVAVLQQTNNPDRLALAAHGLRELMEKSPEYLDLKVAQTTGASLGVKVNELKVSWHGMFKKSKCRDHGKWTGQIDGHLRKFLKRAEAFFEFHEQKFPKLVERARQIVRRFDPLGNLPEPLSNFRASSWQAMDDYFKKVAHHHSVESEQQFLSWMGALELFLLDGLRPRTAMDHADLKKIIEEAEQNA